MVYAVALVSLFLLAGGIAVIVGMIAPNVGRIADVAFGLERSAIWVEPVAARVATRPRVVAVRPLLHVAA